MMMNHKTHWLLVGFLGLAFLPTAACQRTRWESKNAEGVKALQEGRYADAEKLFLAALEKAEGFGPQDPRLATSLNNLAELYRTQGKYAKAEPLHKRVLTIKEKTLRTEHPDVAQSLENYAALLRETGRAAEATTMEARARVIRTKNATNISAQEVSRRR